MKYQIRGLRIEDNGSIFSFICMLQIGNSSITMLGHGNILSVADAKGY